MSKECHLELVVHDSPITPNWTYVPATRSSFQSSIALHQQNRSKNFPDVVSQQLTILVKPHSCKYMSGTKKKMKPQSPVLMAYDISRILPRSTRLVFKKQLMFMHDSVLLSSSVSEILRDDDVVIISATCGFYFGKDETDTAKGSTGKSEFMTGITAEPEFGTHSSFGARENLDDNCLLWVSDEEYCSDSEAQLSPESKAEVDKLLQKLSRMKHLQNNEGKECVILHKKKSKKRKLSKENSETEANNSVKMIGSQSDVEEREKRENSSEKQWEQSNNESSVNDYSKTDISLRKKKKKSKRKTSYEGEVVADETVETDRIQSSDEMGQKIQTVCNGGEEVGIQAFSVVSVPSSPLKSTSRKSQRFRQAGLSDLLCNLRNQQANEIIHKDNKQNKELINEGKQKLMMENGADVLGQNNPDHSTEDIQDNSAHVTPKRKRIRKRKKKTLQKDESTSIVAEISECTNRDYTLRLPEHRMPQNSKITFDNDSDGEGQHVDETAEEVQIAPLIVHHEHLHNHNSVTEVSQNSSPFPDEACKSEVRITAAKPDFATSNSETGVPIDPDEKFRTLLNRCGRIGRQSETVSSADGHIIFRSSRQRWNRRNSNMTDAVDPKEDVLTNVSIITQSKLRTNSTASVNSSQEFHISSAAENNCDGLSSQADHMTFSQSGTSVQKSTPILSDRKVTQSYTHYTRCKKLDSLPMEGDVVAYKVLELSEDYTPGLSEFKEARVVKVDLASRSLLVEPRGSKDKKVRSGRFELELDVTEDPDDDDSLVTVSFPDMLDARLVFRPAHME